MNILKEKQVYQRGEYPRPDFIRDNWTDLNGTWRFAFDDDGTGCDKGYHRGENLNLEIVVPFCYQSAKSGIGDTAYHETVWYSRAVSIEEQELWNTCLLHIGASDYETDIWVNGDHAGKHYGGYAQFTFDIRRYLKAGDNIIAIRVRDDLECDRPRGKQYWKEEPDRCWYTGVTGIWQNVWMELTKEVYLEQVKMIPDIDRRLLEMELYFNKSEDIELEISIYYEGRLKKRIITEVSGSYVREGILLEEEDKVDEIHYWSPDHPNLYDVSICVKKNGVKQDEVSAYFGMRKIHISGGHIFLNNKLFYQRLILDQGYWEDTLLTPPSSDALRRDVELTKKMGFNGARKHQKCEDPRYYYWADVLGLAVWGELPSGYMFQKREIENLTREWGDFINQAYNHPSIITWVPLNESWGVRNILTDRRQQALAKGLYHLTKAYDGTRLVSTNDGWEQVEETDLLGLHDYAGSTEEIRKRYEDLEEFLKTGIPGRQALSEGNEYQGQPILLTEYGGIALKKTKEAEWGYNEAAETPEEFADRLRALTEAVRSMGVFQGFCYTQLTDVMQEVNGLLTAEREPKIECEKLAEIFTGGMRDNEE